VAQRGTSTVAQRWRALGLAALGLTAGGCREGSSGADAGQGANARPLACMDPTVCDGTSGRACRAGRFGFTLRGMDVLASYALTAPTWPCPADATLTGCINWS
jgi:hypothetical protein